MTDPGCSIDVASERSLYVEAVRRASAMGETGRDALCDAHEVYAAAMLAAGRADLAEDAIAALVAAQPDCPTTRRFAARVARRSPGDASRPMGGAATARTESPDGCERLKVLPHHVDTRFGAA